MLQLKDIVDASDYEDEFKQRIVNVGIDVCEQDSRLMDYSEGHKRMLRMQFEGYLELLSQEKYRKTLNILITGPVGTEIMKELGPIKDDNIIHIGIPSFASTGNEIDYIKVVRNMLDETEKQLKDCA